MTRTMSPEQVRAARRGPSKNIDLVEMPGQEIRYLAFNTDAPTAKDKAVRQAMAQLVDRGALPRRLRRAAEPLYSLVPATSPATATRSSTSTATRARPRPATCCRQADITTPVKLTLTTPRTTTAPAPPRSSSSCRSSSTSSGLFDVRSRARTGTPSAPPSSNGKYDVYGLGWFPDFPDADNFIAPFFDKNNFLGSPYANTTINDQLIPHSRREADRLAAPRASSRIQDIVAEDVPVLPLWQGKQYIAARDDITGVEWALNSSSILQLWELGRGVSG